MIILDLSIWPRWDCLVVSVFASPVVGRGFSPRPGHTWKDHHKMVQTNPSPLGTRSLSVLPDFVKNRVVCGTVYRHMHYKDILGAIVNVGYRIPVPRFLSSALSPSMPKKQYKGLINNYYSTFGYYSVHNVGSLHWNYGVFQTFRQSTHSWRNQNP